MTAAKEHNTLGIAQTVSGVDGQVIWWDTTLTDVVHAARLVFGRLMRLAIPVITAYESDLFSDAMWLVDHMAGASFTFFWSVGESGTAIGMDERAVTQAAVTLHHTGLYRVTVAVDWRNRTTLTISPLIPVPTSTTVTRLRHGSAACQPDSTRSGPHSRRWRNGTPDAPPASMRRAVVISPPGLGPFAVASASPRAWWA